MKNKVLRSLLPIGAFTVLYLLIASYFSIQSSNIEFIYYIGVVLILALVVIAVHLRVKLSRGVIWALSIWGLLHMIGGLVPVPEGFLYDGENSVFYSLWIIPEILKYDHVIHVYGFAVATWVCWEALRTTLKVKKPTAGVLFAVALMGIGLGAVNEVVEFFAVLLIPNTNVGGYINTGWDMVSNGVGAVISVIMIRFLCK